MRRTTIALFSTLLLAGGAAQGAFAQGAAFILRNGATSPVVAFQTREEGKWSENWIAQPVAPGETFRMSFNTQDGDCVLRTRVRFQNGGRAEADIDYCEAKSLLVTDKGIAVAGR